MTSNKLNKRLIKAQDNLDRVLEEINKGNINFDPDLLNRMTKMLTVMRNNTICMSDDRVSLLAIRWQLSEEKISQIREHSRVPMMKSHLKQSLVVKEQSTSESYTSPVCKCGNLKGEECVDFMCNNCNTFVERKVTGRTIQTGIERVIANCECGAIEGEQNINVVCNKCGTRVVIIDNPM